MNSRCKENRRPIWNGKRHKKDREIERGKGEISILIHSLIFISIDKHERGGDKTMILLPFSYRDLSFSSFDSSISFLPPSPSSSFPFWGLHISILGHKANIELFFLLHFLSFFIQYLKNNSPLEVSSTPHLCFVLTSYLFLLPFLFFTRQNEKTVTHFSHFNLPILPSPSFFFLFLFHSHPNQLLHHQNCIKRSNLHHFSIHFSSIRSSSYLVLLPSIPFDSISFSLLLPLFIQCLFIL